MFIFANNTFTTVILLYFDLDTQIVYISTGYFFSYTYVKKWENLLSMDLDAI